MHHRIVLARPAPLREWRPELPPGDLRSISLHWTAGDYETTFEAYHWCLTGARDVTVHHTHDLRANMRDVRAGGAPPYAAHTARRNSWSIGVAVGAMGGATPSDFGAWPITEAQVDALCEVAAVLARFYAIPLDAVRTHAEAALDDGYFGDGDEQRWDIARLRASSAPLAPPEATAAGDAFRARIAARLRAR
ncbi:MAG TPA: N-acetylmuramoyl-L-alanine amidase [Candidatus Elarobacter sp.]|jgi:hypothetical protein|nr:N-acetylmuramoyl-L-alanine amidase [Candidatus Elarobacter sp.]